MSAIQGEMGIEMHTFKDHMVRESEFNTPTTEPESQTWGSRVVSFIKSPRTVAVTGALAIAAGVVLIALALITHGAAIPAILAVGMKLGLGLGGSLVVAGSAAAFGSTLLVAKETNDETEPKTPASEEITTESDDASSDVTVFDANNEKPLVRVTMDVVGGQVVLSILSGDELQAELDVEAAVRQLVDDTELNAAMPEDEFEIVSPEEVIQRRKLEDLLAEVLVDFDEKEPS